MVRQIGENALQRTVRLLKEFSVKVGVQDNQEIQLRLAPTGEGELVLAPAEETVFSFETPEQMTKYLEGGTLSQILKSRKAA